MPDVASPSFAWLAADPKTLAEAFKDSGASTAAPSLDWSEYGDLLAQWVAEWLGGVARPLVRALGPGAQIWLPWLVVALALVLVVTVAVRALRALRHEPQTLGLEAAQPRKAIRAHSPEEYRRAALAALERGDARGALTPAWWWFASAVLNDQPDSALTTHDVIARSRRQDLREPARVLDRLRFGAAAPTPPEVRRLLSDLEARV